MSYVLILAESAKTSSAETGFSENLFGKVSADLAAQRCQLVLMPKKKPAKKPAPKRAAPKVVLTVPQKTWSEWSGRQAKVINEQGKRYGLPIDRAHINLADFARAFHDFLAVHSRRLARSIGTVTDPMAEPQEPEALELLREEQFKMARLDRLAKERSLLAREDVHAGLGRVAALLRGCGEQLQKKCGAEALEILNDTLADCEREIAVLLADEESDL